MLCITYMAKLLAFKNCKSLVYCYISEVAVSSLPCLNQISFTFPLLASQAICHHLNTRPTLSSGRGAGKQKRAPASDEKKQRRKLADNQQKSGDQEAKSLEQEPFSTFPGQSRRTAAVERSGDHHHHLAWFPSFHANIPACTFPFSSSMFTLAHHFAILLGSWDDSLVGQLPLYTPAHKSLKHPENQIVI